MVNKKTKPAKKRQNTGPVLAEAAPEMNGGESKSVPVTPTIPSPGSPSTSAHSSPEPEEDPITKAERVKELGNVAFRAKNYAQAIELYTQAIDLRPTEPAYLTNRAASHMAQKRFRPALADCQQAAALQAAAPAPKTLLRLARCQFALGATTPALSTLRTLLDIEPGNAPAQALQRQILDLESHLRNLAAARARRDWGMARLALDKCLQGIEADGSEIPTQWRLWRVELEIARGNWDAASAAANDALRLEQNSPDVLALRGLVLFLTGRLPQALQHVQSALRLDPGHEPAQQLRKRVKDVERLKEEGNTAFKSGRLQEAVAKYSEALERVGESEDEGKGGQIRATLLSNRATTLLKLNRQEDALVDTDASLALVPESFKALRTRARINLHLEKYDASVNDFKAAIQHAGSDGSDADVRALRAELKKAEAALKRSKTKDYYKILDVRRDCTEAEIKKAYRKASLLHHPDKGGDEEKFKLVVEANAVLSDPQRRERYDNGEDEDGTSDGGPGFGGQNMSQMDLAELFAQFHGGAGGGFGGGGFGGGGFGGARGHSHGFQF